MTSKRQKILDATLQLSLETGIDAVSTLNIAKKAGVAKGTLFHHFPTKLDLIDTVYKSIKSDFEFFAAAEHLNFSQQFSYMWRNGLQWAVENTDKIAFLNAYYIAMSVPNARRREAKKESTVTLRNLIICGQKDKIVANENTEMLVEFIHSLFMATAMLLNSQQETNVDECIENSLSIIRRVVDY